MPVPGSAPLINPRDRDRFAAETAALIHAQTGARWKPGEADPGAALVGVFARFAELVVQRLNRMADRHYLAYLNLIGTRQHSPLPAAAALTFTLAPGSPDAVVVNAGTEVAAGDVVFGTDADLALTTAQLVAVVVADVEHDRYGDRSAEMTGQNVVESAGFAAFECSDSDPLVPHEIYVACDSLLTLPGRKNVTLRLVTPDVDRWDVWAERITWDWPGREPGDRPTVTRAAGGLDVTFTGLPTLVPYQVGQVTGGWLVARLGVGLPSGRSGAPPDYAVVGARTTDTVAGLFPFGEAGTVKYVAFSLDEALAEDESALATARLAVHLDSQGLPAPSGDIQLVWTYKSGNRWLPLGESSSGQALPDGGTYAFNDGTRALTTDGEITFALPRQWPRTSHYRHSGRWIRAELRSGVYQIRPRLAGITVSSQLLLPTVTGLTVRRDDAPTVPAPAAFSNAVPLDMSADCYPLGERPGFNDTWYVACPDELAVRGATLALDITLANPSSDPATGLKPVYNADHPAIAWEQWNGIQWAPVGTTHTPADYALTTAGTVTVTLPDPVARTSIGGQEHVWLRGRLVGGGYGDATPRYEPTDAPAGQTASYVLVPPALSPPIVKRNGLSWRDTTSTRELPASAITGNNFTHRIITSGSTVGPFERADEVDPALYLGFDSAFGAYQMTLYLAVATPRPEQVGSSSELPETSAPVEIIWEYGGAGAGREDWHPLGAIDQTAGLSRSGLVRFATPPDLSRRACFGTDAYWLRVRWQRGQFHHPPRLTGVLTNTVLASQAITVTDEILGSATGEPFQSITLAHRPVLPGEQVRIAEPLSATPAAAPAAGPAGGSQPGWIPWQRVPDFGQSTDQDRHYTLDQLTGVLRFGDGRTGRVPARGQNNVRATYRTGGGARGNVPAGALSQLRSTIPYVAAVTNHEPADGGADLEPIDRVASRGPQTLRHGGYAVTAQDIEDLAREASSDVARVKAVPPASFVPRDLWLPDGPPAERERKQNAALAAGSNAAAGAVRIIVVPAGDVPRPTPTLGLLDQVRAYLQDRCPTSTDLWPGGPEWIRVTVTGTVVPVNANNAEQVRGRVEAELARFLHPLTGGPQQAGWEFGRRPHLSDLHALVAAIEGVDHVRSLAVELVPDSSPAGFEARLRAALDRTLDTSPAEPDPPAVLCWLACSLVHSGTHSITVAAHR
jgi:hypothetical protein